MHSDWELDTDALRIQSKKILKAAEQRQVELEHMDCVLAHLPDAWKGETSKVFRERYLAERKIGQKIGEDIQSYAAFLKETADAFEMVDEALYQKLRSL